MTEKSSTSDFTPQRCQHRTLKGRCRQLATDSAGTLSFDHARAEAQARNDFTLLVPLVRQFPIRPSRRSRAPDLRPLQPCRQPLVVL